MRYILGLILVLLLVQPSWAGTWTLAFVADQGADATATQTWGTATATWTPAGTDPSGITSPFQVSFHMDAKNAAMQAQFLALCKAEWTRLQQLAAGTTSSQLSALLTTGASTLNGSAQH